MVFLAENFTISYAGLTGNDAGINDQEIMQVTMNLPKWGKTVKEYSL